MHLLIRYRFHSFTAIGLMVIALLINSCKKDDKSDTVSYFLTAGSWQLASVTRTSFVGDTLKRTDTLNTTCGINQIFQFNNDNSCTYSNYHCIADTSKGSWQLSPDNLTLSTNLTARDTSGNKIITVNAFPTAQIYNLGQYSLVLLVGYTSPYYTSKTVRVITRYGFVHVVN